MRIWVVFSELSKALTLQVFTFWLLVSSASAIILDPSQGVEPIPADNCIGMMNGFTATAIAPRYLITAKHIYGGNPIGAGSIFYLNGNSYLSTASWVSPTADLLVIQVDRGIATFCPIATRQIQSGQQIFLGSAGPTAGASTGNGWFAGARPPAPYYVIWGRNLISGLTYNVPAPPHPPELLINFSKPNGVSFDWDSYQPHEAYGVGGDSGTGILVRESDGLKAVAVLRDGTAPINQGNFGMDNGLVNLFPERDWIFSITGTTQPPITSTVTPTSTATATSTFTAIPSPTRTSAPTMIPTVVVPKVPSGTPTAIAVPSVLATPRATLSAPQPTVVVTAVATSVVTPLAPAGNADETQQVSKLIFMTKVAPKFYASMLATNSLVSCEHASLISFKTKSILMTSDLNVECSSEDSDGAKLRKLSLRSPRHCQFDKKYNRALQKIGRLLKVSSKFPASMKAKERKKFVSFWQRLYRPFESSTLLCKKRSGLDKLVKLGKILLKNLMPPHNSARVR